MVGDVALKRLQKEEEGNVPDVNVPGQSVVTKEAWEVWVFGVMSRSSQDIMNESLSNEAFPQATRTTLRVLPVKKRKGGRHTLKDNVCRLRQSPIREAPQGWWTEWRGRRLKNVSDGSFRVQALAARVVR